MNPGFSCALLTASLLVQTAFAQTASMRPRADTIYVGGDIVTVNAAQPTAEALAIGQGRILAVGKRARVFAYKGKATRIVDLRGKTLLPGFVDGHSHFAGELALWGVPNLNSPPLGPVKKIADIQEIMREHIAASSPQDGVLIYGFGYDDSQLAEHRHPTRIDLDAITTHLPLCLQHISGHLATCNSLALQKLGYTRETPDPQGGKLFHDPQTGELTGVLGDAAAAPVSAMIKPKSITELQADFPKVQAYYARLGYTTVQDGATSSEDVINLLQMENRSGALKLDVIGYPVFSQVDGFIARDGINISRTYTGHLKFAGIKVFSDGSPQGKTAYLSQPYLHPPAGAGSDYRGFPTMPQAQMDAIYDYAYSKGWQVITHANGDAAIDIVLNALARAEKTYGVNDSRPTIIHSQIVRRDQLDRYVTLHVIPSFFEAHTFYWGDWHRQETLGPERAAFISPLRSAQQRGILFSIHSDAPIIPPDPMMLWWCAVNRLTRSDFVLGADERVDAFTALEALTIWPAYQQFDEKIKGTLEPGKYADLVILQENPLKADPLHIKDIAVLETIKQGETIWKRP